MTLSFSGHLWASSEAGRLGRGSARKAFLTPLSAVLGLPNPGCCPVAFLINKYKTVCVEAGCKGSVVHKRQVFYLKGRNRLPLLGLSSCWVHAKPRAGGTPGMEILALHFLLVCQFKLVVPIKIETRIKKECYSKTLAIHRTILPILIPFLFSTLLPRESCVEVE